MKYLRPGITLASVGQPLVVLLCCISATVFVYRRQFETGFSVLFGDRYDGIIAISIIEHWYNVARGLAPWHTTFYFAPFTATLAYNDGYFAHGLLGILLRLGGIDLMLAAEMSGMFLKAAGFLLFYITLRQCFGINFGLALLGAALFTVSNNLYLEMYHIQFVAFSFVPLIVLLSHESARALERGFTGRGAAFAMAVAFAYGIWLLTGFYSVWYFTFFAVAATLAYALAGGPDLAHLGRVLLAKRLAALALTTWLVACLVPFLWLYLPKARETGMHPVAVVRFFALDLIDIVNVSVDNWLWGGAFAALYQARHGGSFEFTGHSTGFTPILLVFGFLSLIWAVCSPPTCRRERVLRAVAIALIATWPLSLRFGDGTPWEFVHRLIPGAGAIRVTSRYQLFLTAPLVLLVIAWLQRAAQNKALPMRVAIAGLSVVLLLEQGNSMIRTAVQRHAELALLQATPAPPPRCQVFFASRAREGDGLGADVHGLVSHNVDAMFVAEAVGLPTINGYSSFTPPGWNFAYPNTDDYTRRVRFYAEAHGMLDTICALDLQARRWDMVPFAANRPGG